MKYRMSFRVRILLLLFSIAVLPLGLLGLWLTGSAARSGELLLRTRLEQVLDQVAANVGAKWLRQRSALLTSAEQEGVAAAAPAASGSGPYIPIELPLHHRTSGAPTGVLHAELRASELIDAGGSAIQAWGAVVSAVERRTGALLIPVPFDADHLQRERFSWGGEEWVVQHRRLAEPPLDLVAAAPLGPVVGPFVSASRRGLIALLLVTAAAVAVGAIQTGRMTRSLNSLALAADAVGRGELDRRVEVTREDEVGRVAGAFNAMTASLRDILRQESDREAHALLGRFASEIAHEVRNPLSAIRIDLQMMGERLPSDRSVRELQQGALAAVAHLERTVAGVLHLARSGRVQRVPVDLRAAIAAAVRNAQPVFARRGVSLRYPRPSEPLPLRGDPDMLQRMVLNVLVNAAEASDPGTTVSLDARASDADLVLMIEDQGRGIPVGELERVFEPFFSTKPEGTGLGLTLVDRTARAHDGTAHIESGAGLGSRVTLRLPRNAT